MCIPPSITNIQLNSFCNCAKLTCVKIPSSVTLIGMRAFRGCISLKEVIIPSSVISVQDYCFENCSELRKVVFKEPSSYPSEYEITLGRGAFSSCKNLTYISLSLQITNIRVDCFSHCTSLEYIKIPQSIKAIGDNAFFLTPLKKIIIPKSLLSVKFELLSRLQLPSNVKFEFCGD